MFEELMRTWRKSAWMEHRRQTSFFRKRRLCREIHFLKMFLLEIQEILEILNRDSRDPLSELSLQRPLLSFPRMQIWGVCMCAYAL